MDGKLATGIFWPSLTAMDDLARARKTILGNLMRIPWDDLREFDSKAERRSSILLAITFAKRQKHRAAPIGDSVVRFIQEA